MSAEKEVRSPRVYYISALAINLAYTIPIALMATSINVASNAPTEGNTFVYGFLIFLLVIFAAVLASSIRDIRGQDDPLVWLRVHATYIAFALLDFFIILDFLAKIVNGFTDISLIWTATGYLIVLLTLAYAFSFFYRNAFLNLLGQKYELLGGSSLVGVAAVAGAARGRLMKKRHIGLLQVSLSMNVASEIFERRGYYPKLLGKVRAVVDTLEDHEGEVPYDALAALALALSKLPRLEGLQQKFTEFLSNFKWVDEIEDAPKPQSGQYQKWFLLVAVLAAVDAIAPDAVRQSLVNDVLSLDAIEAVLIIFGVYLSLISLRRLISLFPQPEDIFPKSKRDKPREPIELAEVPKQAEESLRQDEGDGVGQTKS